MIEEILECQIDGTKSNCFPCVDVCGHHLLYWSGQQLRFSFVEKSTTVATIQRIETAWSEAFLRGDTAFMGCLLAPDYTEIMRSGELKTLSDELAIAEKNRGKGLKISERPRVRVLLHEHAAVAYSNEIVKSSDGKSQSRWYSDTYLWKDGRWHAFFAQQTASERR